MLRLEDLSTQLAQFVSGEQSLESLQRWLTPVLVEDGGNVEPESRELFLRVLYLVDDDSISVETRRHLSDRVLRTLRLGSGVEILDEWFEFIMRRDQLKDLLGKLLGGVISRTSYLSGISEAALSTRERELLATKDHSSQRWLVDLLTAEDYGALLVGPPGWGGLR
jgi:hypothetical protein